MLIIIFCVYYNFQYVQFSGAIAFRLNSMLLLLAKTCGATL